MSLGAWIFAAAIALALSPLVLAAALFALGLIVAALAAIADRFGL